MFNDHRKVYDYLETDRQPIGDWSTLSCRLKFVAAVFVYRHSILNVSYKSEKVDMLLVLVVYPTYTILFYKINV